jgi:hypothetical protein
MKKSLTSLLTLTKVKRLLSGSDDVRFWHVGEINESLL